MKRAADKLAAFVAARGRAAEEGARAKNPGGDTPFRFLHDKTCNDYRYYESKIAEAKGGEKLIAHLRNCIDTKVNEQIIVRKRFARYTKYILYLLF